MDTGPERLGACWNLPDLREGDAASQQNKADVQIFIEQIRFFSLLLKVALLQIDVICFFMVTSCCPELFFPNLNSAGSFLARINTFPRDYNCDDKTQIASFCHQKWSLCGRHIFLTSQTKL